MSRARDGAGAAGRLWAVHAAALITPKAAPHGSGHEWGCETCTDLWIPAPIDRFGDADRNLNLRHRDRLARRPGRPVPGHQRWHPERAGQLSGTADIQPRRVPEARLDQRHHSVPGCREVQDPDSWGRHPRMVDRRAARCGLDVLDDDRRDGIDPHRVAPGDRRALRNRRRSSERAADRRAAGRHRERQHRPGDHTHYRLRGCRC